MILICQTQCSCVACVHSPKLRHSAGQANIHPLFPAPSRGWFRGMTLKWFYKACGQKVLIDEMNSCYFRGILREYLCVPMRPHLLMVRFMHFNFIDHWLWKLTLFHYHYHYTVFIFILQALIFKVVSIVHYWLFTLLRDYGSWLLWIGWLFWCFLRYFIFWWFYLVHYRVDLLRWIHVWLDG